MNQHASSRLSFIVRVWLEEPAGSATKASWRGFVRQVPSGATRYFDNPDTIVEFVRGYLAEAEAQLRGDQRGSRAPEGGGRGGGTTDTRNN